MSKYEEIDENEMERAFGKPRTSIRWTRDDGADPTTGQFILQAGLSCGDVVTLQCNAQQRGNVRVQMRLYCPALPIGECSQQYPPRPLV